MENEIILAVIIMVMLFFTIKNNRRKVSGIKIEAVPDEGSKFVKWSDGVTKNPRYDFDPKRGLLITPVFEKITCIVRYIPQKGGKILLDENHEKEEGCSLSFNYGDRLYAKGTIKAIPMPGYRFVQWSDGVTSPERPNEKIKKSKKYIAQFKKIS